MAAPTPAAATALNMTTPAMASQRVIGVKARTNLRGRPAPDGLERFEVGANGAALRWPRGTAGGSRGGHAKREEIDDARHLPVIFPVISTTLGREGAWRRLERHAARGGRVIDSP